MKYLIRRDNWGNVSLKKGRKVLSDYSRVRDAVRGAKRHAKRIGADSFTVKTIDEMLPYVEAKTVKI